MIDREERHFYRFNNKIKERNAELITDRRYFLKEKSLIAKKNEKTAI